MWAKAVHARRRALGRFTAGAAALLGAGVVVGACAVALLCSLGGCADPDVPVGASPAVPAVKELVAIREERGAGRYIDENGVEQNGLASGAPIEGGRLISTPRYAFEVPDCEFPAGYTWEYARDGMAPAPEGAHDVVVVTDGATGEPAVVAYTVGASHGELLEALGADSFATLSNGYRCFFGGIATNARLFSEEAFSVFALPEERASGDGAAVWGQRFHPLAGSYDMVQGIEGMTASPEAYLAWGSAEDGRLRITTPSYTVLLPEGWTADAYRISFDSNERALESCSMRIADPETTFWISLRFSDAPVIESPAVREIDGGRGPRRQGARCGRHGERFLHGRWRAARRVGGRVAAALGQSSKPPPPRSARAYVPQHTAPPRVLWQQFCVRL